MVYDLIIIGGGPAGVAAGVYAARKKLTTLLLTQDFGGQSIVSAEIQNWIGERAISGEALAAKFKDHVMSYVSDTFVVKEGTRVSKVEKKGSNFNVSTEKGQAFETKTVLLATGAHRRKLTVPGATEFEQKGITYCATCDGPLFGGRDVVIIGGGNAGFETALQLLAYAKSVTLLHHSTEYRADPVTMEKVLANPKMKAVTNAETVEVKGDKFVTSLVYKDKISGATTEIPTQGVFVEIGLIPSTEFVKDLVTLTPYGAVVIDPCNHRASVTGIWAAGDGAEGLYHQNNIAAGDGVKALEDIYLYLHTGK